MERALIAGHDVVLLGERGQGKTRILRTLVGLLDEWTPVIVGSELGEHPYHPITLASQRRAVELGDDLPVTWRHRDDRYAEKLATPDTSAAVSPNTCAHASIPAGDTRPSTDCTRCSAGSSAERASG